MDPEFGDDLANGFSGPSDVESESSADDQADHSLDLLSALMEDESRKANRKRTRAKTRIVKSKAAKPEGAESRGASSDGEMAQMRQRMEEMQAELRQLRQQVAQKIPPKQQQPICPTTVTNALPSNKSPPKKLATGEKLRVAHQPREDHPSRQPLHSHRATQERHTAAMIIEQRDSDLTASIFTEKYSGLRIKNPLVSSELMSQRMQGRKMIRIPRLVARTRSADIEGDWVTIGVIVDKLPPKDTKKGDKYSVWKLSDLSGQSAVVSVFLFGQAYQEHWKTSLGYIVALLNPSILPDREGKADSGSVALSLDHPKRLMLMGVSQDFTRCKAHTKSGQPCPNFAKSTDGGYCDYHVQRAYSKSRTHRMELQAGYGPSSGSLRDKLFKGSKTNMFFAEGRTFVASKSRQSDRGGDERLFVPGAQQSASEALQELREQRGVVNSRRGVVTQEGSEIFKEMLQKQSLGARILSTHLQKEKIKKEVEGDMKKSALQLLQEEKAARRVPRPLLGRGIVPGGTVELGARTALAKRKAAAVLRTNSGRGNDVMRRVEENRELSCDEEPQSKRPRMSSEEVNRVLNAKSSHDWVNEEIEREREDEYFQRLEKKEDMELKLQSIKELRVSVVQCKECNYIAEHPGELCRKEGHKLSKFKAYKKCFQCQGCNARQFVYSERCVRVDSCSRCGGTTHIQVSLYRERKGPTLPTEQLKLRGDEEKFLNSLR